MSELDVEIVAKGEMVVEDMPLGGRHALVTGGGKGIGAAIAAELAAYGADVTLLGRDGTALQATCDRLREGYPTKAFHVQADVLEREQVENAVEWATNMLGPIDILVNNAGIAESAPFLKTDEATFRRLIDVNLTGVFHCTQAVLPGMVSAGFGRVINVASTAGLKGYAYVAAYVAAKHGVIGLTRSLALEFATHDITFNAVCPGYTDTELVARSIRAIMEKTGRSEDEARAELVKVNPQKRMIEPREVAEAVVFLALPTSRAITGQSLAVAGGEVM